MHPDRQRISQGSEFERRIGYSRAIVDGREHVRIHGEQFKVNARIHTLGGFSAHGDQEDLLRWHAGVGGKPHTYLVHGEAEGASGLSDALRALGAQAEVAKPAQGVDLTRLGGR